MRESRDGLPSRHGVPVEHSRYGRPDLDWQDDDLGGPSAPELADQELAYERKSDMAQEDVDAMVANMFGEKA